MIRYGKESLDALEGKILGAMASTPVGSVDLTDQEITIVQEMRACIKEAEGAGIAWTPIIVIGGLLGFAILVAQPWSR